MKSNEFFKENKYVLVENFISPEFANFIYQYTLLRKQSSLFLKNHTDVYRQVTDGAFGEPGGYYLSEHTVSYYADPLLETLLQSVHPNMELLTGLDLHMHYSFLRLYDHADVLLQHKDRMSCDVSATICLGWDYDNLDTEYSWPIMLDPTGGDGETIRKFDLKPGDAVLYKGCELLHWRDKLLGNNHAQAFLHYTDNNGKFANETGHFDGRPMLGIPKPDIESIYTHTPEELNKKYGYLPSGSDAFWASEKEDL
jgi:hypothetical protein